VQRAYLAVGDEMLRYRLAHSDDGAGGSSSGRFFDANGADDDQVFRAMRAQQRTHQQTYAVLARDVPPVRELDAQHRALLLEQLRALNCFGAQVKDCLDFYLGYTKVYFFYLSAFPLEQLQR
jgi:hypothetical protein